MLLMFAFSLQTFLLFSILCDFSFKVGWALVKKKFLKKTLSNGMVRRGWRRVFCSPMIRSQYFSVIVVSEL